MESWRTSQQWRYLIRLVFDCKSGNLTSLAENKAIVGWRIHGTKRYQSFDNFQIIDIEANIVLCTPQTHEKVADAIKISKKSIAHEIQVFCFGKLKTSSTDFQDIISMLNEINLHDAPVPVEFNDEELDTETAIIFWTSGTTGKVTQGK